MERLPHGWLVMAGRVMRGRVLYCIVVVWIGKGAPAAVQIAAAVEVQSLLHDLNIAMEYDMYDYLQ